MAYMIVDSPIGPLTLLENDGTLTRIDFGEVPIGKNALTPVLSLVWQQLKEYFAGHRTEFTLPLNMSGSDFQKRVWSELQNIPYGQTRTYGQIAKAVGSPKASRAVGGANHNNPIPIIVPCHRVVGAGGKLTGYAGGLEIKSWLLCHEQSILQKL